jgi:phage-related protein
MASDLGTAYVQIVPSATGISGSISSVLDPEATKAGKSAGLNIAGGIGSAIVGGATIVAGATAAVTGAVVKGTSDLAAYGDNIDKMSQKMGMSAEAYQEWDAVMQHSGTSMEAMKSSMKTLANAAETGSDAFELLGISQEQIATMSQEELFEATITALQNVEDETQRTYLAGKTLGKGATELGALLNTSAEDTQAMRDRVHELGGVMSDEAVKNAAAFQDNLQDMQTAISGVGRGLVSQLLPGMNQIMEGFTGLILGEEGASEALSTGFESLFESIGSISESVVSMLSEMLPGIIEGIAGMLPQLIEMATSLLISLAESLVSALPTFITTVIPSLLMAAGQIIIALGDAIIQTAPQLVSAGISLFEQLKSAFNGGEMLQKGLETVQGLLSGITSALPSALESGVSLLSEIVNGILSAIPQLITTAGELVVSFTNFLLENAPSFLQSGVELLLNVVSGITSSLPEITSSVGEVIAEFIASIATHLPEILEQGITLLGELCSGIIQALPDLLLAVGELILTFVTTLGEYDWLSIGSDILQGIINGLMGMLDSLVDAVQQLASAIWDEILDFFDIGSPSKLAAWAGQMIDEGWAGGIQDNADLVEDAVSDLSDDVATELQMSPIVGSGAAMSEQTTDSRIDRLIQLMEEYLPQMAENRVVLEGDAEGLFNVMQNQNKIYKRMNGESAFA